MWKDPTLDRSSIQSRGFLSLALSRDRIRPLAARSRVGRIEKMRIHSSETLRDLCRRVTVAELSIPRKKAGIRPQQQVNAPQRSYGHLDAAFYATARLHKTSYEFKETRGRPFCLENTQTILVWNASNGSPSRNYRWYEHAGIARLDSNS